MTETFDHDHFRHAACTTFSPVNGHSELSGCLDSWEEWFDKSLTAQNLKQRVGQENVTIINTLPEEHFKATQIPTSINVPQTDDSFVLEVEKRVNSKDQPVVVYCANEDCNSSTKAAQKLEKAGFTQVYDFEGGAKAWQESGEALAS